MALTCLYIFNQVRFKEQYVRTRCYVCLTATVRLNRSNRLLAFLLTVCKTQKPFGLMFCVSGTIVMLGRAEAPEEYLTINHSSLQ